MKNKDLKEKKIERELRKKKTITLTIDPVIFQKAKDFCKKENWALSNLVEDLLDINNEKNNTPKGN